MTIEHANILRTAFDEIITKKYGTSVPPSPYITPFGIRTVDALIGGGLQSSAPIGISSTPETGKSTISLQFASVFQRAHENCVAVYVNIEEAAGGDSVMANVEVTNNTIYHTINDRIASFGIDPNRFLNKPAELDVKQVFDLIADLVEIKRRMQVKTNTEFKLLVIWDSIAATPSSKDKTANDPNEVIGFKARELTFNLAKMKETISMERVTFIVIDQVRANMKIENRFQAASNEKGVGDFGNYKSATAVSALQHHLRQWLWLSRGKELKPSQPLGVDGWILNMFTEKNKLAPSHYSIPLVFDKKWGVIPFYSEYLFLCEKTKTERKYWKDPKKLNYPFCISSSANSKVLTVIDPITDNILYKSTKVMERKILERYNNETEFHYWFDKAVEISVDKRIKEALFRDAPTLINTDGSVPDEIIDEPINTNLASEFAAAGDLGDVQSETDAEYDAAVNNAIPVGGVPEAVVPENTFIPIDGAQPVEPQITPTAPVQEVVVPNVQFADPNTAANVEVVHDMPQTEPNPFPPIADENVPAEGEEYVPIDPTGGVGTLEET